MSDKRKCPRCRGRGRINDQACPTCDGLTTDPTPESVALLERRLEDGYQRIEAARDADQDTTAWEDFWIDLLHQYEAESRALGLVDYDRKH